MTYVILQGNCLDVLKTIPSNIVQTCVTSPPYFGLRDYGTASWEGGSVECDHRAPDEAGHTTKPSAGQREHAGRFAGKNCYRCGAKRIDSQIGLEATPQAYVDSLVQVFREIRRVLRDDGTLWLNLGDSYANDAKWGRSSGGKHAKDLHGETGIGRGKVLTGLKPKDLIGIPWRVAFALQSDGWYLRQWHPWVKRNAMPESTKDRPTTACETIFLLTKSAKYFYNYEAVKQVRTSNEDANGFRGGAYTGGNIDNATVGKRTTVGNKLVDKQRGHSRRHVGFNDRLDQMHRTEQCNTRAFRNSDLFFASIAAPHGAIGNREELIAFDVAPRPFKESHFATFPPDLIRPCILAGAAPNSLILDPFGGAGTIALVSEQLGRHSISIELNPDYVTMARTRVESARLPV